MDHIYCLQLILNVFIINYIQIKYIILISSYIKNSMDSTKTLINFAQLNDKPNPKFNKIYI